MSSGPLAALAEEFNFDAPFCASESAETRFYDIELFHRNDDITPTGTESVVDTSPFSSTGGLTLDSCRSNKNCLNIPPSFSSCLVMNRGLLGEHCTAKRPTCRCLPFSSFQRCRRDEHCVVGEVCVIYVPGENGLLARLEGEYDLNASFCASADAERNMADLHLLSALGVEDEPTGTETVVDTTTSISPRGNLLAFDVCHFGDRCTRGHVIRFCGTFMEGDVADECSPSDATCRCVPLELLSFIVVCDDHDDCIVGEGCVKYTGPRDGMLPEVPGLDVQQPFCMSIRAVSELKDVEFIGFTPPEVDIPADAGANEDGDGNGDDGVSDGSKASEVCIDARLLSHMKEGELVFKNHILATVICDTNKSCATPGHMVLFEGVAMSMRRYCGRVGCTTELAHVNSPRYRRGLRVATNTKALEFTPFAARYESRVEELFLTAMLRLGL